MKYSLIDFIYEILLLCNGEFKFKGLNFRIVGTILTVIT